MSDLSSISSMLANAIMFSLEKRQQENRYANMEQSEIIKRVTEETNQKMEELRKQYYYQIASAIIQETAPDVESEKKQELINKIVETLEKADETPFSIPTEFNASVFTSHNTP